jgi:transposase-like protein
MFKKVAIMSAFFLLDRLLIQKINYEPAKNFFKTLLNPARQMADVMTDSDPNNTEQIKQVLENNKLALADLGLETAKRIVADKVKDETLKMAVLAILDEIDEAVPGDTPNTLIVQNYFKSSLKTT